VPKWALLDQKDELASRANVLPSGTSTLHTNIKLESGCQSVLLDQKDELASRANVLPSGTSTLHTNIKLESGCQSVAAGPEG
jgi:hypothetical protein